MNKPLASIVVPVFNADEFLPECIDGLLRQTYEQLEILVVDDGSTDGSIGSIERFRADPRLRVISQENSGGPASPRNRGASEARGEFVFFFDADDIAKPGKVEATVGHFERDAAGRSFAATEFEVLDQASGRIVEQAYMRSFDRIAERFRTSQPHNCLSLEPQEAYEALLPGNFVGTSSVAVRRAALLEVGDFDTSLQNGDDYEMWLRLARHGGMLLVGDVLHTYRRRNASISRRTTLKLAPNRIKVLQRQLEHSLTPRQRNTVSSRIAENYSAMAWEAKDSGQYGLAVRCYVTAIRKAVRLSYFRGLLAALVTAVVRRPS